MDKRVAGLEFLLVVRYRDDAERKRLEYLMERYGDRMEFHRPEGAVIIVRGGEEDLREFLEELYARLPPKNIRVNRLEDPGVEVGEKIISLELETRLSPPEIQGALTLVMARLRGVLVSTSPGRQDYRVRVRGGHAEVRVSISPLQTGTRVVFQVEAYGHVVEKVASMLEEELRPLGEVRRVGSG